MTGITSFKTQPMTGMTSYKTQPIRVIVALVCVYLPIAHVHFVPCTLKPPGLTMASSKTTIPSEATGTQGNPTVTGTGFIAKTSVDAKELSDSTVGGDAGTTTSIATISRPTGTNSNTSAAMDATTTDTTSGVHITTTMDPTDNDSTIGSSSDIVTTYAKEHSDSAKGDKAGTTTSITGISTGTNINTDAGFDIVATSEADTTTGVDITTTMDPTDNDSTIGSSSGIVTTYAKELSDSAIGGDAGTTTSITGISTGTDINTDAGFDTVATSEADTTSGVDITTTMDPTDSDSTIEYSSGIVTTYAKELSDSAKGDNAGTTTSITGISTGTDINTDAGLDTVATSEADTTTGVDIKTTMDPTDNDSTIGSSSGIVTTYAKELSDSAIGGDSGTTTSITGISTGPNRPINTAAGIEPIATDTTTGVDITTTMDPTDNDFTLGYSSDIVTTYAKELSDSAKDDNAGTTTSITGISTGTDINTAAGIKPIATDTTTGVDITSTVDPTDNDSTIGSSSDIVTTYAKELSDSAKGDNAGTTTSITGISTGTDINTAAGIKPIATDTTTGVDITSTVDPTDNDSTIGSSSDIVTTYAKELSDSAKGDNAGTTTSITGISTGTNINTAAGIEPIATDTTTGVDIASTVDPTDNDSTISSSSDIMMTNAIYTEATDTTITHAGATSEADYMKPTAATMTDNTRHVTNRPTSDIDTTTTTLTTTSATSLMTTRSTTDVHPSTTSSGPTDILTTSESTTVSSSTTPNLYALTTSESTTASSSTTQNLYAPVFYEDIYYADVYEDVPVGTVLLTVQALDWDQGSAGEITYNISSGAGSAEGQPDFAVHSTTGVVAVIGRLDRERKGEYMINLTATDKGEPEMSAVALLEVFILDVNDNAPVFDQLRYEAAIDEDAQLMSRVLIVIATDADRGANSNVIYRLSGNHKNAFSIDETNGLIRTRRVLDRERVAQYSFSVVASDHGSPVQRSTVDVIVRIADINDNPPVFPGETIFINATENNLPFSPIGKVTATDADEGPNAAISYAFVERPSPSRFEIDRETGIVYTVYRFDREQRAKYEATVRASSGRLFTDARLVVRIQDVNDNPPMVPETQEVFYNFYSEFTGCNAIGKVGALDKDSEDSLHFRLVEGRNFLPVSRVAQIDNEAVHVLGMRFSVDKDTGMIRACHRPSPRVSPTAELTIEVSDGIHSKTCVCTIYISRVTDQSLRSIMSLQLRIRTDAETFFRTFRSFITTVADIFQTSEDLITALLTEGLDGLRGDSESPALVRMMLAVRRRDGTVVEPDELRSIVYLELEQLQVFADILPDPLRPQCRLVPAVAAGGAGVVTEVALGITCTRLDVTFSVYCEKTTGSCDSDEACKTPKECTGQNHIQGNQLGCKCPLSGDASCKAPSSVANCSAVVCNDRGSCRMDDGGDVRCVCRDQDRYDGPRCQMTSRRFTDGSFLAFMPLGRFPKDFNISLRFKSSQSSGLLLYNGQLGGKGESISLQLVGSRLQFRKSGRAGANSAGTSASIAANVTDGNWHRVFINHKGGNVIMGIDNCTGKAASWSITDADPSCLSVGVQRKIPRANSVLSLASSLISLGFFLERGIHASPVCLWSTRSTLSRFLNLNAPLFLGGMPQFVAATRVTSSHFVGCLKKLEFNSVILDFSKRLKNVGTSPRCNESKSPTKTTASKVIAPRSVRSLSCRPRMRTLIVKWTPPRDKSGEIGYQISYTSVNDVDEAISATETVLINGPSESSYTIQRLVPDTRYQVAIRAFSTTAFGEAVSVFTKTKSSKTIK